MIIMKKMNNKGYMLVEIILAFSITFTLLYFMMDLVLKIKNKNDDLLVEGNVIKYKNSKKTIEDVIVVLDDTAKISYNKDTDCGVSQGRLKIKMPVTVKQMNDEKFDILLDYYYDHTAVCNPVASYRCKQIDGSFVTKGDEPYAIDYDGRCEVINDGNGDWRIKFLEEGEHKLKVNCDMTIDAFLVGGGGGGSYQSSSKGTGGGGGGGGYTKTVNNISLLKNTNYEIIIGAGGTAGEDNGNTYQGGTGGTTYAFDNSVDGGGGGHKEVGVGGDGGSGGGQGGYGGSSVAGDGGSYGGDGYQNGGSSYSSGKGQGTTTCEFGEGSLTGCDRGDHFAYSGGGGGGLRSGNSSGGKGGKGGGGGGGNNENDGKDNTGGGGGGQREMQTGNGYRPGKGGSGVVVIRNAR